MGFDSQDTQNGKVCRIPPGTKQLILARIVGIEIDDEMLSVDLEDGRTIADLADEECMRPLDLAEALQYRPRSWNL